MDRFELKIIRKEIDEALAKIGTAHNISLKTVGSTTYDTALNSRYEDTTCITQFKVKVEGAITNADGVSEKELTEFAKYAKVFGLEPDDFGKKFTYRNSVYTITGLKTSRPKFPIQAVNQNGTSYKFPADQVVTLLKK